MLLEVPVDIQAEKIKKTAKKLNSVIKPLYPLVIWLFIANNLK